MRDPIATKASNLVRYARRRARLKGLTFEITKEWVEARIRSFYCEATGLPFDLTKIPGRRNPYGPSLDRKDPSQGYTRENTQVVVWIYNTLKSDFGEEEVSLLVQRLAVT